ncbi:MAG: DAK2 domain-containing protein [Gaiellaceae bacterium]
MGDIQKAQELARGALLALERNRRRLDDLNVYPVPDGDTGTNLTLTVRAAVDQLQATTAPDLATLAKELTRAALMGARGNSGVILSQIVRGFAEAVADAKELDAATLARAFRGASDAAYAAVTKPVEGTMLTVIREMAEEAEAHTDATVRELIAAVVLRGADAVERTPELLDVLRTAGVVDAGGAGLLEIVRGIAAVVAGEPIPDAPVEEALNLEAVHQELSRYRYCTVFVVEGSGLDRAALQEQLERLGDSLLVVGDPSALKVHVHTDEPGTALALATAVGTLEQVEIANMHKQTERREERLLHAVPDAPPLVTEVVAVVAGAGNRSLFESTPGTRTVEGGQSLNPSAAELVAAIDRADARSVIVLPNNSNVILAAEQAADLTEKDVRIVRTDSIPAGLAAIVAFDGSRDLADNAAAMEEAAAAVVTGAVTVASKDAQLNGLAIRKGNYLGLANGEPVAQGESFDEVSAAMFEALLVEPRAYVTVLKGIDGPDVTAVISELEQRHPGLELEVHEGGQPHYALLVSAE